MQTRSWQPVRMAILGFLVAFAAACGESEAPPGGSADAERPTSARGAASGLTADELENGIGPIRQVELDALDPALVAEGEQIFTTKCSACHKMDERYVGPALGGVLDRRSPAFVMNMMLNPDEMVARHPEVKAMLAQYYTPMPDQQLTEPDARAVLEYLRQAN